MQRSKIEVGEEYGVVPRFSKNARQCAVKATVVSLEGEYQGGGDHWGRHKTTLRDGIAVRFEKPMIQIFETFEPADSKRVTAAAFGAREAAQEVVLESPKHVIAPWAEIEAERDAAAALKSKTEEGYARRAAEFLPKLNELRALLERAGFEGVALGDDETYLYGKGVRILLESKRVGGRYMAVGFDRSATHPVKLGLDRFEQLLAGAIR